MNRKPTTMDILHTLLVVLAVLTLTLSESSEGATRALLMAMKTDESQTALSDEEHARLYFAYGSNLDEDQMAERCLTADKTGLAQIKGYRFVINRRGVASILESPEDVVEGVLWSISAQDERILDFYEGVATGHYIKKALLVEDIASGEFVEALVYVATESEFGTPRPGYLEQIIRAAEKHGFTEPYLRELRTWQ
ncbi:MAG TPA: gamma-glutamylcyclotransferase [Firmicutes bacterium]|nr:gamma-glutamylcyclotransferase [Bacillota bacterium]